MTCGRLWIAVEKNVRNKNPQVREIFHTISTPVCGRKRLYFIGVSKGFSQIHRHLLLVLDLNKISKVLGTEKARLVKMDDPLINLIFN